MSEFSTLNCSGCGDHLDPHGFSLGVSPEGVVALCLDCAAEQAARQILAGDSPEMHFIGM